MISCIIQSNGCTVKNEVCKAHQNVSIHTLLGEKCGYRDILVCIAHFSIYSVELVNRGGLFPLNDDAFRLFIEIELCVRIFLPEHMLRTQSDKDTFLQNVHDKISLEEDVQFYWTLLSQELLEDTETLLKEIIKLWVLYEVSL